MSKYDPNRPRPRRRTIIMPEDRSFYLSTAATYLGMTGEDLIQLAITEKLRYVYRDMVANAKTQP